MRVSKILILGGILFSANLPAFISLYASTKTIPIERQLPCYRAVQFIVAPLAVVDAKFVESADPLTIRKVQKQFVDPDKIAEMDRDFNLETSVYYKSADPNEPSGDIIRFYTKGPIIGVFFGDIEGKGIKAARDGLRVQNLISQPIIRTSLSIGTPFTGLKNIQNDIPLKEKSIMSLSLYEFNTETREILLSSFGSEDTVILEPDGTFVFLNTETTYMFKGGSLQLEGVRDLVRYRVKKGSTIISISDGGLDSEVTRDDYLPANDSIDGPKVDLRDFMQQQNGNPHSTFSNELAAAKTAKEKVAIILSAINPKRRPNDPINENEESRPNLKDDLSIVVQIVR